MAGPTRMFPSESGRRSRLDRERALQELERLGAIKFVGIVNGDVTTKTDTLYIVIVLGRQTDPAQGCEIVLNAREVLVWCQGAYSMLPEAFTPDGNRLRPVFEHGWHESILWYLRKLAAIEQALGGAASCTGGDASRGNPATVCAECVARYGGQSGAKALRICRDTKIPEQYPKPPDPKAPDKPRVAWPGERRALRERRAAWPGCAACWQRVRQHYADRFEVVQIIGSMYHLLTPSEREEFADEPGLSAALADYQPSRPELQTAGSLATQ